MSTVKSQLSSIANNATQHGTPTEGVWRCPLCYVAHPTSDKLIACVTKHEKESARTVCAVVLCENDASTTDSAGRKICAECADNEPKPAKPRKGTRRNTRKAQAPVETTQAPEPVQVEVEVETTQAPVEPTQAREPKSADVWAKDCYGLDKRFAVVSDYCKEPVHQKSLFKGSRLHKGALNLERIRAHATESGRIVIYAQGTQYAAIGVDGKVHCAMEINTLQEWQTFGATVKGMLKGAKANQGAAQAPQTIAEPVQAPVEPAKPAKPRNTRKAQAPVEPAQVEPVQAPVEPAKPAKAQKAKAVEVASEATGASAQAVAVAHQAPADVQSALVDAISALSVGVRALSHLVTQGD